jgi:hypothetical protein
MAVDTPWLFLVLKSWIQRFDKGVLQGAFMYLVSFRSFDVNLGSLIPKHPKYPWPFSDLKKNCDNAGLVGKFWLAKYLKKIIFQRCWKFSIRFYAMHISGCCYSLTTHNWTFSSGIKISPLLIFKAFYVTMRTYFILPRDLLMQLMHINTPSFQSNGQLKSTLQSTSTRK